ncbi:hypothetical protein ABB26_10030 [Stenotrophomonas humi]|uniref:Uncharacterized protein n=1 Tax=Stenotrophomonas humi TaxID=405444 RepID=A0A0R0C2Z5_9GAMM|nr:hypothetical protein [Stenotrophomonas humi]KRG63909.1 hypothetical protein ABB26_10030 [Stenotrophomonas humi]
MTGPGDQLAQAIEADELEQAEAERRAAAQMEEEGAVKAWLKRIEESREFDKAAREGYAKDRTYCQEQANADVFDVRVPIAGTYVGILTTFLYARDPETSVELAEAVSARIKEDAKAFATTLEIVIGRLWKKGKLKAAADPLVRSGLSVGIGWMKAAWHRETGNNAALQQDIVGLQSSLAAIDQLQVSLAEGIVGDDSAQRAELEQQLQQAEDEAQRIIFNALCIDFVRAEDIQVAPECASLQSYADSPWIAQRLFMPMDKAKATYPDAAEFLGSAMSYFRVPGRTAEGAGFGGATPGDQADAFTKGAAGAVDASKACVCIWEIWNKQTGHVVTVAEGCSRYLRQPFQPEQRSTRYYPFFNWAVIWNDGARHPQSLVDRSRSLLDEYNRVRTNFKTHRRRAIPKTGFDRGTLTPEDAKRLEDASSGEMVGLDLQGQRPEQTLFPISYNQIDPALYDTQVIRAELEMIWGVQEALSSSIQVAKTATEADIQQQGTESRIGYARDGLDEMLSELAAYTAELATSPNGLAYEDAAAMAGDEAMWFNVPEPEMLDMVVQVDIRAGSSGKPATALRQQQWSILLPQLQQAAIQIGQMRQSSPLDIANCLEQLAVETVKRAGDTGIDPYTFIPQPPAPVDPMAMPLGADQMAGDPALMLGDEGGQLPIDPSAMPDPAAMMPPAITPA